MSHENVPQTLCPHCGKYSNNFTVVKPWYDYSPGVRIVRLQCECGNSFNYHKSANNTWTNPRSPILDKLYYKEQPDVGESEYDDDIQSRQINFRTLCQKKILASNFSNHELTEVNFFIDIVEKMDKKSPFIFLPTFVEDFMTGQSNDVFVQKYHLRDAKQFRYIVEAVLRFKGRRVRDGSEALSKNLENELWKSTYDLIMKYSNIFQDELTELLNQNLLRGFTVFAFYQSEGYTIDSLISNFEEIVSTNKHRIKLLDETGVYESFQRYSNTELPSKIRSLVDELVANEHLVKDQTGTVCIKPEFLRISDSILSILLQNPDGIFIDKLRGLLGEEMPILRYIQRTGIWESALVELEKTKIKRMDLGGLYGDKLFLRQDYHKKTRLQTIAEPRNVRFYGRKIKPEKFISELLELEKGDLGDADDQVTRIAGLILADSASLAAPYENMEEFDFAVDISNYEIKPDKVEVMRRLDFTLIGRIIHCKLMIDEKITRDLIRELEQKLPYTHQGVLFTVRSLSNKEELIPASRKIQIVDREGIQIWSEATPVIPCRRGAIAQIMCKDKPETLVRVDGVDYESRSATVTEVHGGNEFFIDVGCLQEIEIGDFKASEFSQAADNCYEFLKFLADNAKNKEDFQEAILQPDLGSMRCLEHNRNGEVIDACNIDANTTVDQIPFYKSLDSDTSKSITWEMTNESIKSKISYTLTDKGPSLAYLSSDSCVEQLREMIRCNCLFFNEQSHSYKLCKHVIRSLVALAKTLNVFGTDWDNRDVNIINEILLRFQLLKNYSIIEHVVGWFENDSDILDYIERLATAPDEALDVPESPERLRARWRDQIVDYVKILYDNSINVFAVDDDPELLRARWRRQLTAHIDSLPDTPDGNFNNLKELWKDEHGSKFAAALSEMEEAIPTMNEDDLKLIIKHLRLKSKHSQRLH